MDSYGMNSDIQGLFGGYLIIEWVLVFIYGNIFVCNMQQIYPHQLEV